MPRHLHAAVGTACALLLFATACADARESRADAEEAGQPREPALIDHMEAFEPFVADLRAAETADERRAAYGASFAARDPAFYEAFVGDLDGLPDRHVIMATDMILETEEEVREFHALARRQIPEATEAAERAYGVELSHVPQHVTLNLLQSNAQVRLHEGEVTILYGLDTWAALEEMIFPTAPRDFRVTVAHELFHAHHWSVNPFMARMAPRFLPPRSDAPLWINLWSEGLATCAARHVYPDADIALVLAVEGIWEEAEGRLPELAQELAGLLDETDEEVTGRWLYLLLGRDDGLPPKAGYIVGAVAAHRIVAERGLEEATRLAGDALRAAMDEAFGTIAAGEVVVSADALCRPEAARAQPEATGGRSGASG